MCVFITHCSGGVLGRCDKANELLLCWSVNEQSTSLSLSHGRDSKGDYCFKYAQGQSAICIRGFYWLMSGESRHHPAWRCCHSQLPVDGGGDRSETAVCVSLRITCYLSTPEWQSMDPLETLPPTLFWMHACVLMCLWGDDGVRLIEYQLALRFFSVMLLFMDIFQVFSWIRRKSKKVNKCKISPI